MKLDLGCGIKKIDYVYVPEFETKFEKESASIDLTGYEKALVRIPSRTSLELMLENVGFDYHYYDWHSKGITNWKDLEDYRDNLCISLVAKNLNY